MKEEKDVVDELLASSIGNQLHIVHAFVQNWYCIWWEGDGIRQTPDNARNEYPQWWQNPDFRAVPALSRAIAQITDDRFEKISYFLKHEHWEAKNGCEQKLCMENECRKIGG